VRRIKAYLAFILVVAIPILLTRDWGGHQGESLNVIGSSSVQPFAEMLSDTFNERNGDFQVHIQGGGSTVGVQATREGTAHIGMCSRSLKKDEALEFKPITIARDGLAIVIHPSNPVDNLTIAQVRDIFSGKITNWKDLGWKDGKITAVVREESSGTREAFMKLVMDKAKVTRKAISQDSNGAIKELVRADPHSIGFMSLGLVTRELKAVKIDGVPATNEGVLAGKYPLVRPFLFVTKGDPNDRARKFIEFVLSDEGQKMLETEGLVRAK
jgi:phosphate transport system substrate-binding protein